jgi:thymidylate synthase
MIVFKSETFAKCYRDSLEYLFEHGLENRARSTVSKELLDVALVVEDPAQCLYDNLARGSQRKYIAAEFIWYYMGRKDVKFISQWAKFWETIQNSDGSANSAYGNLLFTAKNEYYFSQYEWAMQSLISDPNTRQAVMHLNTPAHQYHGNKDFVCTMYVNCHIRDNRFYMTTFMRSNDAVWGTPTDVAFFCSLQMQMLAQLRNFYPNLQLGTYTHVANSYHVYDRHYELVEKMLASDFTPDSLPEVKSDLINIDGTPSPDLITLAEAISANEKRFLIFQDGSDLLNWIYRNITLTKDNVSKAA